MQCKKNMLQFESWTLHNLKKSQAVSTELCQDKSYQVSTDFHSEFEHFFPIYYFFIIQLHAVLTFHTLFETLNCKILYSSHELRWDIDIPLLYWEKEDDNYNYKWLMACTYIELYIGDLHSFTHIFMLTELPYDGTGQTTRSSVSCPRTLW